MAASCRHFIFNSLKFYQTLPNFVHFVMGNRLLPVLLWRSSPCWTSWTHTRSYKRTSSLRGIEEFFPAGIFDSGEPLPEQVRCGRSWRAAELRQKSNEDLHKLWYILLKERNMLLTIQGEAKRQEIVMPSPERLHKVKKSMAMIQVVIGERTRAIQDIERKALENLDCEKKEVEVA